ncbi:MAG: FadR/GntR family transcriptional regulator [Acidimicrobiia bacterium]|nr:FadR/GntR family transcriptional regulator [Acidimicrobiia bacterium]
MKDAQMQASDQVRVPKMAELIASKLRRRIVRGELVEGDALPSEATLMEQFGVSRPTLREAFRVLESEGLVTIRRGARGGARVHVPDGEGAARYAGLVLEYRGTTVKDVHDALLVLEPACVVMLATEHSVEQLEALKDHVARADNAVDDLDALIRIQTEFHTLVVELAGNETLRLMSWMLRYIVDRANWSMFGRDHATPTSINATRQGMRAHARIVEAIEAHDPQQAEALWRHHLAAAGEYLVGDRETAGSIIDILDWSSNT